MQKYKIILTAFALVVLSCGTQAFATSVFFDFEGECLDVFGGGCSAFGLSVGDNVFGTFTFDESLVIPGAKIQPIGPSTLGMDFSLTFGNLQYNKSDLQDLPFTVVEFSTPDASSLVGFGTQMQPVEYAVGWINSFSLVIFGLETGSQVFVRELGTAVFENGAIALGVWTRRQTPIPEPSTMLLFGTGLAGIAAWRWRRGTQT